MATLQGGKNLALQAVARKNPNLANINKALLKDKDVILAYIKANSSNYLLLDRCPINLYQDELLGDVDFIITVIQYLDLDYSRESLLHLIKKSTSFVFKNSIGDDPIDMDKSKEFVLSILKKYDEAVKVKEAELKAKNSAVDEIDRFIEHAKLTSLSGVTNKAKNSFDGEDRYKRTRVGFSADI